MAITPLTPVIRIDEEKCINCYACIVICPVKYCMNGSGDKLLINHDICIGCGNCINACTHKARTLIDDTSRFMEDLKQKKKIIAVAAPAVASFFPDQFLNLNGWLKSLGVEAFFDVSLGAELTVMSYLAPADSPRKHYRFPLLTYFSKHDSLLLYISKEVG